MRLRALPVAVMHAMTFQRTSETQRRWTALHKIITQIDAGQDFLVGPRIDLCINDPVARLI